MAISNLFAFLDTETTGLDPEKHEIIEIGCVLVQLKNTNGENVFEVIEEFEYKVKPEKIEIADPVALRVNGYNEADWIFALKLSEVMKIVSKKTKNAILVGHNVAFDYAFLQNAFAKTGEENLMHYHKLDTISMAFAKLCMEGEIGGYSLHKLTEKFGIVNTNAHTALADARATFELFKKLVSMN